MKRSQRLIDESNYVEATLGNFSSICSDCKAKLSTFADRCTADLDVPCPGYLAIERAKHAFARTLENKPL